MIYVDGPHEKNTVSLREGGLEPPKPPSGYATVLDKVSYKVSYRRRYDNLIVWYLVVGKIISFI